MPRDLVILAPDGAYQQVLPALLARRESLGIREVTFDLVKDALHDSSPEAVKLVATFQQSHARALVFRDYEGSGVEARLTAAELVAQLEGALTASGWEPGCAHAIVAQPEIEDWLRIPSPHLQARIRLLARRNERHAENDWAERVEKWVAALKGRNENGKPVRPKESFAAVLQHFGVQPSNAHYRYLAERESLKRCASPSFQTLLAILRKWFPK